MSDHQVNFLPVFQIIYQTDALCGLYPFREIKLQNLPNTLMLYIATWDSLINKKAI